jgi:mono/diheme cytochrome c family protein
VGTGGSVAGTGGAGGSATSGAGGAIAGGAGGASGGASGASPGGGGTGGAAGGSGGAGGTAQMSPEEALYTTNCSACHGPTGEGSVLGPEIRHPVEDFAIWMVRNGTEGREGGMNPFPGPMVPLDTSFVSDAELGMIISYLSDKTKFPQPTTGEGLYLDYCASCHGADGKGAGTTRDLTNLVDPLATAVPDNVRSGHHNMPPEFNLRIEYMPAQDATVLSDAELMLIATHIEGLP